ncbi:murein biosynthesis integral membrane protein MurJ [Streptosporangium sp. NPDC051023]|uniref:murein biosynthesis integral membrane protein MurJ n=1 Tax=Streptosporangium sp. NPDC051023 TaxID=3155410 RepID=UPI0034506F99
MREQPRLARAGRAMAVATLISKITGFLRTLTLVAALGLGSHLFDAYTAANTLPNSIYDLVLGGALTSILVPLLIRHSDEMYAQRLLSLVVYGLGVTVVVTMLFAPQIVDLCVSDFTADQRRTAIILTRFFLPQILFYGAGATVAAVLSARDRQAAPMWAPVANNLVVIATAAAYLAIGGTERLEALTTAQTWLLGAGTSAGVAVQLLVLCLATRGTGFRMRLRADPRGVGVRRIAAMASWTLVSVVAAQAALIVVNRLTSGAGPGALGVHANAYTLFQLPYAIVTASIITGVLPRLSRAAAESDLSQVTAELSQSLRLSSVVLLPVAAALVVLGPQVTTVLFAHGNADPSAAALAGSVLAVYGLALVPFCGYQIMLRGFYALQDTRTPAMISLLVTATTVAGAVVSARLAPGPQTVVGIAAGYAVAQVVGFVAAALVLRRRIGRVDGHRLLRAHGRMLVAAVAAGGATAAVAHLTGGVAGAGWAGALLVVAAGGSCGALCYALATRSLRVIELRVLIGALRYGGA